MKRPLHHSYQRTPSLPIQQQENESHQTPAKTTRNGSDDSLRVVYPGGSGGDGGSGNNNNNNHESSYEIRQQQHRMSPRRTQTPKKLDMLLFGRQQQKQQQQQQQQNGGGVGIISRRGSSSISPRKVERRTYSFDDSSCCNISSVESSGSSSSSSSSSPTSSSKQGGYHRRGSAGGGGVIPGRRFSSDDPTSDMLMISSDHNHRRISSVRKRPTTGVTTTTTVAMGMATTTTTTSPSGGSTPPGGGDTTTPLSRGVSASYSLDSWDDSFSPMMMMTEPRVASSLSFRRKKRQRQQRRKGFYYILHTKNTVPRIFIILMMLFVMSFAMAFMSSRQLRLDFWRHFWPSSSADVASPSSNASNNDGQGIDWGRLPHPSFHKRRQHQMPAAAARREAQVLPAQQHEQKQQPNNKNVRRGRLRGSHKTKKEQQQQGEKQPPKQELLPAPPLLPGAAAAEPLGPSNIKSAPTPAVRKRQGIFNTVDSAAASNGGGRNDTGAAAPAPQPSLRGSSSSGDTNSGVHAFAKTSPAAPSCNVLEPDDVSFTVVSQLSLNRLWMMEYHCQRWMHNISIAVYVGGESITADSLHDQLVNDMGCSKDKIAVQTVSGYSEEEYPVNVLRNKALAAVRTTHVVYVDVDFWESTDLYEHLQFHKELLASDAKHALVIPAFQLNRQCREWRECPERNVPLMPKNQDDLFDLMMVKRASAFDPTNLGGHGSTKYTEWISQDRDALVPIDCVLSNRYEPYLVFRYCQDLPPFQESFTGYGKNKMTWVMQLRRLGYRLWQIGGSFLVHYPHLDSKARLHWNGGDHGEQIKKPKNKAVMNDFKRAQVDQTFVHFRTWLEQNIPDRTVIPMCEESLDDDTKLWIGHE